MFSVRYDLGCYVLEEIQSFRGSQNVMVMSLMEPGTKNDFAGEGHQQFSNQSVFKVLNLFKI
jgi:hypothetical protein